MRVLILTTFDLDEYVVGALRAGATGFLANDVAADDLVAAMTHVGHPLAKLGLRDRVQAVVLAYETGLGRPGA